jgi:hypothetical protein
MTYIFFFFFHLKYLICFCLSFYLKYCMDEYYVFFFSEQIFS